MEKPDSQHSSSQPWKGRMMPTVGTKPQWVLLVPGTPP